MTATTDGGGDERNFFTKLFASASIEQLCSKLVIATKEWVDIR